MPVQVSDRACFCLHVKTATWILIVIQLIFACLSVVQGILGLREQRSWETRELISLVIGVLFLVSIILVVIALIKHRPGYMVLHMVMSLIYIIWVIAYLIWYVVEYAGRAQTEQMLRYVIIQVVIAVVMTYLLYVEYCCYIWMGGTRSV